MSRRNSTHGQWQATLAAIASIAMVTVGSSQAMPPQGSSTTAADQDIVKRHLTAARNLLSDVTELPAAAQLTGDTRVQVQRLINTFNELIATGSDWRPAYATVDATLDSLLRPQGPSGQAGAVGTSGTPGLALDASIRAKLMEFRAELDRFEAAASGNVPAPRTADQPAPPRKAAVTPQDLLVHIEAVEVILGAQAAAQRAATARAGGVVTSVETPSGSTRTTITSPDVTLNAEQLQQIRTHLTELRRLVEQK